MKSLCAAVVLFVLSGCFDDSVPIQVGLVVAPSATPRPSGGSGQVERAVPDQALDHDCFVLNVTGPGIPQGIQQDDLPNQWNPHCLELGSLSTAVSRADLLAKGLTVATLSGPKRRVELLGMTKTNGISCSELTRADWFSGVPVRLHVLGTKTLQLKESTSLQLENLYSPQAPEEKIAPCAPPPILTGIFPSSGNVAGGTPVRLTGSGFLQDPVIQVGALSCAQTLVLSDTEATCVTATDSSGAADVTFTNRGGTSQTLPDEYTFNPGPLGAWNFIERETPNTAGLGVSPDGTAGASEVVEVGGKLWLLWKERDQLYLRQFGGNYFVPAWPLANEGQPLVDGVSSLPEVVVFDGKIIVAYQDVASKIRVGQYVSGSWQFIDGGQLNSASNPAVNGASLATLNGKLYASFTEFINPENFSRLKVYDGTTWNFVSDDLGELDQVAGKDAGDVALIAHGSQIFVAWTEIEATGFYSILKVHRYNPTFNTWGTVSADINTSSSESAGVPHLHSNNSSLFLTWRETVAISPEFIHAAKFNGTTWDALTSSGGLREASDAKNPRIFLFGDQLYLTWFEIGTPNQVYVFRHNGGTTWSNTLGSGVSLNFTPVTNARNPRACLAGNALHVTFTQDDGGNHDIRVTLGGE